MFLESVLNHLENETIELGLQIILDKSVYMIKNYLPREASKDLSFKLFNAIMRKLETTKDSSMKNLLATNMLSIASST